MLRATPTLAWLVPVTDSHLRMSQRKHYAITVRSFISQENGVCWFTPIGQASGSRDDIELVVRLYLIQRAVTLSGRFIAFKILKPVTPYQRRSQVTEFVENVRL